MSRKHSYIIAFWRPFSRIDPDPSVMQMSSFFQKYSEIQCLDCGKLCDSRTGRLMGQADLVVILLHQDCRELNSLYLKLGIRFQNCVWLITDYIPGGSPCLEEIMFRFRIPRSRLAYIPYTPRPYGSKKNPGTDHMYSELRRELNHAGHIMLRALGF